jgi:hypothetical protein
MQINDFHARRTLHRANKVCKGTVPIGTVSALLPRPVVCAFGVWRSAFGVRRLAFGVWRLAFGVWRLAFGVWRLAFGVHSSVDFPLALRKRLDALHQVLA